jgi:cytochrome c556
MNKRLLCGVLAIVLVGLSLPVSAQDARVAGQVKLRQSAYTVLGAQMGIMGNMLQGRVPYDAKAFQIAAERAAFMATVVPDVFPAGSMNASSKAKAELWSNAAEFQKLMNDLQTRTAALVTAAQSGNLETIKPALGATGASCKACHDKYKAD